MLSNTRKFVFIILPWWFQNPIYDFAAAIAAFKMEVIFDCFFDETFARLERSGLHSRQKRRDVIDHLNAIILGTSKGMLDMVGVPFCSCCCFCWLVDWLIYSFGWVLQWRCTIFSILLKVFVSPCTLCSFMVNLNNINKMRKTFPITPNNNENKSTKISSALSNREKQPTHVQRTHQHKPQQL